MSYLVDRPQHGLTLAITGGVTTLALDDGEDPAVRRAARDLAADLAEVCGCTTRIDGGPGATGIVVGTIGVSRAVDAAIARGDLDVAGLRETGGTWRWEGYLIQAAAGTLYIAGTDRRGTIFGVYELCEAIGVSPWRWFADVPLRRREHVTIRADTSVRDYPSLRYRGIFVNDEEELAAWAAEHTRDATIGPQLYARIFELILRLKGNYIWPAMHVNSFNADPENGRLAHEMGVVVGTSHCDMLLRSNQTEWDPWLAAQGEHVEYDYSIPGRNREKLLEYWGGSVEQNRAYEVSWTLGMRGVHDSGLVAATIDADRTRTEEEKRGARVALLAGIIRDQRKLIGAGGLQIFVPYKEVLPLYDAGLDVPEDVTIVWTDDNFGYVRRYPSTAERGRPGGHGLYYHSSYWSQPPRSYLFIGSAPLAHMKNELRKAWEQGIRTLWVDNVGALKPLELEMEFFLRYAWEVGKETSTADVTAFTADWIDRAVPGGHGARAAEIYQRYAQITNTRKIEHLTSRAFSQTGYGDEGIRRVAALRLLYDQTNEILAALPGPERDAFFQLLGLKVHASYLTNAQFYYADRSTLAHEQGKLPAADHYLALSREFDTHKRAMIRYYNVVMAGGKWNRILTPDSFPPPATALFPAGRPALRLGASRLGVVAWGDEGPVTRPELTFAPDGVRAKWIEVFSTGAEPVDFEISADDWISVAVEGGRVATEARIGVTVPDPAAVLGKTGRIVVHSPADGREVTVEVVVEDSVDYLAFFAPDADEHRTTPTSRWVEIPHLGRGENGLMEARGAGATLGYHLELAAAGAFLLEVHRFPSLDATGRIRLGVSVDDQPPVVVESPTTDEWRGAWTTAVLDNVERLYLRLPWLDAGHHLLRIHAVDDYVAISRLVVYLADRRPTNLGPQPGRPADLPADPAPDDVDLRPLDDVRRLLYRVDPAELPPHPVLYIERDYWNHDTTFTRATSVPRVSPVAPRRPTGRGGRKDLLAAMPAGAVREHRGAIALAAARTLLGTADAYRTPSLDEPAVTWVHTQAETAGGTGLAMHVDSPGRRWADPLAAPGLHQRIHATTGGTYHVWLLVKYDSRDDDACVIALDGTPQPISAQFSGGDLYSFGSAQHWVWTHLSDLHIPAGPHTFSILARKSRLRVDRGYLTVGDERPPADAAWRTLTGA